MKRSELILVKKTKYSATLWPMPMEGLVRIEQVLMHFPVSKSQLYQLIAEGLFPRQIKIGRSTFWDAVEVRKFLKNAGALVSLPGERQTLEA